MQRKTGSPEETFAFGEALAKMINRDGIVLCLAGDLGAGKTLFVQGLAKGLHVEDEVTSPTFALMNVYHGDFAIYHFDLYRLERPEQLQDIGFYEYTEVGGSVVIIEWPDKFSEELPGAYIGIRIERGKGETERIFTVDLRGERDRAVYEELIASCRS